MTAKMPARRIRNDALAILAPISATDVAIAPAAATIWAVMPSGLTCSMPTRCAISCTSAQPSPPGANATWAAPAMITPRLTSR